MQDVEQPLRRLRKRQLGWRLTRPPAIGKAVLRQRARRRSESTVAAHVNAWGDFPDPIGNSKTLRMCKVIMEAVPRARHRSVRQAALFDIFDGLDAVHV